jgi:hypothetical protein
MKKATRQILVFLCSLILGPIFGCLLGGWWYSGADTFWKRIDYFPLPVSKILALKPFGEEFWVETTGEEIYKIVYPCSKDQTCWTKARDVPSDISDGNAVDYKVSDARCENNNFVYPLFHKIKMCITSATHAPDATWTVSLALTNAGDLWIWDQPWESPYTVVPNITGLMIAGAVTGIFIGLALIIKLR